MEGIDKLTLELLMNKTQYSKYLSIKDPSKYEEIREYQTNVAKYKDIIMQLTDEYCDNHNKQNSTELDEAFSNYVKSCIRFIEMKQLEEEPKYEKDKEEDVLFGPVKSFWGTGAIKKNM
jgi:predicted lipoprotein